MGKSKKMKRLKAKRGFTMVELLATIVILGILTSLSITAIQRVIANAKEKYYHSQEDSITAAARNYAEKNKQYLPKASGQIANISLDDLIKAKYISEVVDYSKNKCSHDDSYVQIFYYENEYHYTPYLKCDSWKSNEIDNSEDIHFTWNISGGVNDAKVYFKIEDNTNGLASYIYRIYADGKLVFTSDQFELHKAKKAEKTINLTEFTPAKLRVVVTATSAKGMSATESKEKDYSDGGTSGKPECDPNPIGASRVWTTGNRKISVKCIDGTSGIGCAREWFTKEFTNSAETDTIKISDKNGNSRNCEVPVFIDKDYPVLTGKVYKRTAAGGKTGDPIATITANNSNPNPELTVSNKWLNKKDYPDGVYFEISYSDLSGVKQILWQWNNTGLKSTASTLYTWKDKSTTNPVGDNAKKNVYVNYLSGEGYRIGKVSMTDQVEHTTSITFKVPMDRTAPTCTNSGASESWVRGSRDVTTTFNDSVSGVKGSSPGKVTYKTTMEKKTYAMEDNAGNKSTCTVNVFVDNTAPINMSVGKYQWKNNSTTPTSKSGLTSYTSGWSDKKIFVTADSATDAHSGGVYYQYKTSGATGDRGDTNGSSYNVTQEGESKVWFRACDVVGNCTNYSEQKITIEYNKPTAPTIDGSTGWNNSNRIVWTTKDGTAGAGVKNYQYCRKSDNSSKNCEWKNIGENNDGGPNNVDIAMYHQYNADLINAFKGNVDQLTNHWNTYGKNENRVKSLPAGAIRKARNFSNKGDYYVFFRTVSNSGATSGASNSVHLKVDKKAPDCKDRHNENTTWTNGNVRPSVDCEDADSGCTKSNFAKTFTETGEKGKIQIKDNAGNTKNCEVDIFIDKDPPKIKIDKQPYANKCNNANGVTAVYTASDSLSGLSRVGDYWGFDDSIHSEYTISRGVSSGADSFSHTHNWSANCKKTGSASPGDYCYKIKISAKDRAGNEATHISSGCSKIGG